MAAILRRLQSYGIDFPAPCDQGTKTWAFSQKIDGSTIDFFRYIVKNHSILSIEYSIHCTQLARDLLYKNAGEITEQIETALMLAELMEHIYRVYLKVPREVERFRREQTVYRSLLADQGYHFACNGQIDETTPSLSETIRELTGSANWPRNFIVRLRRLLVSTIPLASDLHRYLSVIRTIDKFCTPVLTYLAWIFFIPRALTNLFLTGKHVIPGTWMNQQEESLGWQIRLMAQMESRWLELGNDIVWLTLGVLNCFVLTGALAPIGFYGSAILLAYDVVLASLRVYIEISRLQTLEKDYSKMLDKAELSPEETVQTANHLCYLGQRIAYEQKRLYIQVVNTSLLLLAFSLAFPLFAFNPIIALIGAALAVLTTIACYASVKWVEQQKPVDKVTVVQKKSPSNLFVHGFFKPAQPIATDEPELQYAP